MQNQTKEMIKMYLYNSLTRKKENIENYITDKSITFYSCGQTVYKDMHIGNTRTYGYWDILVRWLRFKGYQVTHVQNFTDVGHLTDDADSGEDKIEKESQRRNISPYELVDQQIKEYWQNIDALNIERPNIAPRASAHIPEMIEFIKMLLIKKHAYEVNGSVYYDITTFPRYGELSPTFTYLEENDKSIHRTDILFEKRNPQDFALWINAENSDHIMRWPSPWSDGYPGWHLECSVMVHKYLGETIDIHGGGIEHLALHHPNEIAQSEAVTGQKMAHIWLHANHLLMNDTKMSKSLGNTFSVRDIIKRYSGPVIRFFYATTHYRKTSNFSEERIQEAQVMLQKIVTSIRRIKQLNTGTATSLAPAITLFKHEFSKALDEDLNTPAAVQTIMRFTRVLNSSLNNTQSLVKEAISTLITYINLLGIDIQAMLEEKNNTRSYDAERQKDIARLLLVVRNELRKEKHYKIADYIREELQKLDYIIEDRYS